MLSFYHISLISNSPLTIQKKVAHVGQPFKNYKMLIFLLSANRPPFFMRLKCGVFLLLPNLPAYELANMSDF